MINYCNDCKEIYDLNERAFEIFNSRCDVCGRPGIVSVCPFTKIDRCLEVVIWKKPIKIQVGRRMKDILINKFANILSNVEMLEYRRQKSAERVGE